jgi:hypothetical protein
MIDDQNIPTTNEYVFELPPVVTSEQHTQQVLEVEADKNTVLSLINEINSDDFMSLEMLERDEKQNQLKTILAKNGWMLNGWSLVDYSIPVEVAEATKDI